MAALARLETPCGVRAMQQINLVVLNPLFLGVFMGTAGLSAAAVGIGLVATPHDKGLAIAAAGLIYLIGSLLVTTGRNVPLNNRLKPMDPGSADAAGFWPVYVRQWTRWNHVRTAACLLASLAAAAALTR
jgi:uncharacterized membrane protein